MHIEGTLEPELNFQLAKKHGLVLQHASVEDLRRAYRFANLQSFLDIYYDGAAVLRDADDFHDLAQAYFHKAHAQGVVHAEIFFDPQTHSARGIALGIVLEGLRRACAEAERDLGISGRTLILCFLRHLSADEAMRTLEDALPHKEAIAAVGLDSSELGHPARKIFGRSSRVRGARASSAVAHAGEEGPPSYIYEALDILRVRRVDHGVRCEEDSELVERLARERVPLTVCPLSNCQTQGVRPDRKPQSQAPARARCLRHRQFRRPGIFWRLPAGELSRRSARPRFVAGRSDRAGTQFHRSLIPGRFRQATLVRGHRRLRPQHGRPRLLS